jgi:hypothetical protein
LTVGDPARHVSKAAVPSAAQTRSCAHVGSSWQAPYGVQQDATAQGWQLRPFGTSVSPFAAAQASAEATMLASGTDSPGIPDSGGGAAPAPTASCGSGQLASAVGTHEPNSGGLVPAELQRTRHENTAVANQSPVMRTEAVRRIIRSTMTDSGPGETSRQEF